MNDEKNILEKLLLSARNKIPPNELHLCHFFTIINYVRYFDDLDFQSKKKAFDILNNYLTLLDNGMRVDRDNSLELFKQFISPLIITYESLGFTAYVPIWLLLIWFLIMGGILFFLTKSIIVLAIVAILLSTYYGFVQRKKKNNKVHGFKF